MFFSIFITCNCDNNMMKMTKNNNEFIKTMKNIVFLCCWSMFVLIVIQNGPEMIKNNQK